MNPDADIVYSNALSFGDSLLSGGTCWYSRGQVTFTSLLLGQRDINSGRKLDCGTEDKCVVFYSVLARRTALERVGLFDANRIYQGCDDLDLWLRCIKSGSPIIYHDRVLVRYRRRGDSMSSDPVWMLSHLLNVLSKARENFSLTTEEEQVLDNVFIHCEGNRAFQEGKRAFSAGDIPLAIELLQNSNKYIKSFRLSFIIWLIRSAPRLARNAYDWRRRLLAWRRKLFTNPLSRTA